MTRRVAFLLASVAAVAVTLPGPVSAQPRRQVILVLTAGVPYERALREPPFSTVAGTGGIGLMTTSGGAETFAGSTVSIGAGRAADSAPRGAVPFSVEGSSISVDVSAYRSSAGEAEPGLLGTTLATAGVSVGYVGLSGTRGDPAMLSAMDAGGHIPHAYLNRFPVLERFPEALAPEAAGVFEAADLIVSPDLGVVPLALEATSSELLVVIASPAPNDAMREDGDTVTPIALGPGMSDVRPAPAGLTSGTTRRDGLVSNVDIAPTVLEHLGVPVPDAMVGSPIEIAGEPPTGLHERWLEWRGVAGGANAVVLAFAAVALVAGLVAALRRAPVSRGAARLLTVLGLAAVALHVALVPAALLPTFSWLTVFAALAGIAAILVAIAGRLGRGSDVAPVVLIAVSGLSLVVLDAALGWTTGLTPLLGGSALDGERFYGLGNPYAGLVLAGAVLGASRLGTAAGAGLLGAAALFAGLPFLGADLGGGLTLATVTGLWIGLRRWGDLGWRTWLLSGAGLAAGLGILLLAHEVAPPTHVSRAVGGGGVFGAVEVFWRRLSLNLEATNAVPPMWLAILGLPVWLAVTLRPPAGLRAPLDADARWRQALVALAIGGILGYVLNDTFGMAAIAFVFLSGAAIVPALRARAATARAPATAPTDG